jgi:hypothetical protein
MNKMKSHLNTIGLTLVFAGLAALRIWPHRKTAALIIAGLGVAALIVYLVLHLSHLKKSVKRKSFPLFEQHGSHRRHCPGHSRSGQCLFWPGSATASTSPKPSSTAFPTSP